MELSIAYNYFYSPLCSKVAENLPMWLAYNQSFYILLYRPNLISMIGFLCIIIPHLILPLFITNDIGGEIPSWYCYLVGVTFFIYMICDNTDGKQARRTGSSSPFGMLMDHGMDCFTSMLSNITVQVLLQIGNGMPTLIAQLISTLPFFFSTMEQYYTGELVLGYINGVDEGSVLLILTALVCGYFGSYQLMNQHIVILGQSIQIRWIFFYGLITSSTIFLIPNLIAIYKVRNSERFKKLYESKFFLSHILWFPINAGLFILAANLSPSNIMSEYPRRVHYAMGFQFVLVCLRQQYAVVTLEKFNPFRRTCLLTWALLLIQIYFSVTKGQSFMHEPTLYLIISGYTLISIAHLVFYVSLELTTILDINVFTLTKKQLDAQKETKRD